AGLCVCVPHLDLQGAKQRQQLNLSIPTKPIPSHPQDLNTTSPWQPQHLITTQPQHHNTTSASQHNLSISISTQPQHLNTHTHTHTHTHTPPHNLLFSCLMIHGLC